MKIELFYTSIILIIGFIIAGPLFSDGFLVCQDNPPHQAEAYFLVNELIPEGKLFGWAPMDSGGFPIFMYDYPLGFWLLALIRLLLGLDVILSYKMIVFISYVGVSLAFFLAFNKRLGAKIALILSILLLLQFDFISFPLNGLWSQYFSMIFLILFIHFLDKAFREKPRLANLILLGVMGGLVILSHPTTTFYMGILTLLTISIYVYKGIVNYKRALQYLIIISSIALAMSIFYIYPILDTLSWVRPVREMSPGSVNDALIKSAGYMFMPHLRAAEIKTQLGWVGGTFVSDIFMKNLINSLQLILLNLSETILSLLFIIGVYAFLKAEKKDPLVLVLFIGFIIASILGSGLLSFLPIKTGSLLSNVLQFPRYFVFARLSMVVLSGLGIAWLIRLIGNKSGKVVGILRNNFYLISIASLLLLLASYYPLNANVCNKTSENLPEIEQVKNVWTWVKANVDGRSARVLYQDTFETTPNPNLRYSHIFSLSYHFTDVSAIGTWQGGAVYVPYTVITGYGLLFDKPIELITEQEMIEWMKVYNIKYIVTSEEKLRTKLENSNQFSIVKTYGEFTVFELKGYVTTWVRINNVDTETKIIDFKHDGIVFKVNITNTSDKVTVKISHHPYWKGYVNDKKASINNSTVGLIEFVPNTTGEITVKLQYARPVPF